ncbi:MAG: hypothetical protein J7M40_19185 [Planctomycetes bacterium]|nr:hypothetical protein [Planctomycetota bacterium]
MKNSGFVFSLLIVLMFVATACQPKARREKVEKDEPLLLLDDVSQTAGGGADNSRCHVCHINFATEELSVTHAGANVGCEDCHGESDAHCGDEDNITPPEIMYPESKINAACLKCHGSRIKMTTKHKAALAGTLKKTCTGCHGEHRMSHRTRRWNKETGELISDDKVRMLTDDMIKEEKKKE